MPLNKLQLSRLDNPEQQLKIITRSPEQYKNIVIEDISVEDLGDKSIQVYQHCCVVFDDMLDSNQKIIGLFLLVEVILIWMFNIHHSHISICLNAAYAIIVIS